MALIVILVLFGLFGLSRFFKKTDRPLMTKANPSIEKPIEALAPAPTVAQPNQQPEPASNQPAPVMQNPITLEKTVTINKDPFCLYGKQDFIALPDFYLKSAYSNYSFLIAIPTVYAKCFETLGIINVVFFVFNKGLLLPEKALVSGRFNITEKKQYSTQKDLITETRSILPMPDFFKPYSQQNFTLIKLDKSSLEDYPAFHPMPPSTHAFSSFVGERDIQSLLSDKKGILIDVRSKNKKAKKALSFTFSEASFKGNKIHDRVLEISEIKATKLRSIKKLDPSTPLLLLGSNQRDFAPYNAANFLASYGFYNTYILNSPSNVFNFTAANAISNSLPKISPEKAKEYKNSKTALFIDLRQRGDSHGTIDGSYQLGFTTDSAAPEEDSNIRANPNIEDYQRFLNNDKYKTFNLVFVGANDADKRSIQLAETLSKQSKNPSYWLADGYRAWGFYTKYKWDDQPKNHLQKKERRGKRRSTPPERKVVRTNTNLIKLTSEFGKAKTETTKPTPVTEKTLLDRKKEIQKNRKKSKNQLESSRQ